MLTREDYKFVLKNANLTSIDLIVKHKNKYLLGKRINNPAKNTLFVPGGVIRKNETFEDACKRIAKTEINVDIDFSECKCIMISRHVYENNFADDSCGTVYLCIAYEYELTDHEFFLCKPDYQHDEFYWVTRNDILNDSNVHFYTKRYFDDSLIETKNVIKI